MKTWLFRAVAIAAALVAVATTTDARPRSRAAAPVVAVNCPDTLPHCIVPATSAARIVSVRGSFAAAGSGLVEIAQQYQGTNPTGWSRVWCGNFMRMVVREAGLPDHPRGNLARSWSTYGRASEGPEVGAIAVLSRGKCRRGFCPGHVGIVAGVTSNGDPILISGNHYRRVGTSVYPKHRVLAYRTVPS